MPKINKFLTAIISLMLMAATWFFFTTVESRLDTERNEVLERAVVYIEHGIYDRGIAAYNQALRMRHDPNTLYALAHAQREGGMYAAYRNSLQSLINGETPPADMSMADLFIEAFEHDREHARMADIINLLRTGWQRTGDYRLHELFNTYRYAYITRRHVYDYAQPIIGGTGRVYTHGLGWGFVNADGVQMLAPQFELATNFFGNYAAVQIYNEPVEMINRVGNRQAVAGFSAYGIHSKENGFFSARPMGVAQYGFAVRDGIQINALDATADFIGLLNHGIRAVQLGDRWAIQDRGNRAVNIETDFIYESIAVDEIGRAAVNERIFVKQNGSYTMLDLEGNPVAGPFDAARPFFEAGGLAAVSRNGLWGLINNSGNMVIDFIHDEARSSGFSLVPVRQGDYWGYISIREYPESVHHQFFGRMVIEPRFLDAKQFANGVAPVLLEQGWVYISLIEWE